MSTMEIPHTLGLDLERLKLILKEQYAGKYEIVDNAHLIGFTGFMVKKNAFQGVAVSLEDKGGKTLVTMHTIVPSILARLLGPVFMLFVPNPVMRDLEAFFRGDPKVFEGHAPASA